MHKGAFGIVPDELDGFESSMDIPAFDVNPDCLPEWIYYFLKQGNRYLSLESLAKGTGSKRIHPESLYAIEMPLPLIDEQHEILKRIANNENRLAQIDAHLDHQQTTLVTLRQSILREAVQGQLTARWRQQNTPTETGADLLKRIRTHKQQLIAAGKLKKEKPLPPITADETPFELPDGWVWCRLGDVVLDVDYGTSEKATESGDVPILRMNNIVNGALNLTNLKYVSENIDGLPKLYLKKYELIFNRTNSFELVGKCGIFVEDARYTLASYLIRVAFPLEHISVELVNFYINSALCRQTQIEPQIIQQTGQANFSGSKLKEILFPLAPFAEQQAVVERVTGLFGKMNALAERLSIAKQVAGRLRQAVLREAFAPEIETVT